MDFAAGFCSCEEQHVPRVVMPQRGRGLHWLVFLSCDQTEWHVIGWTSWHWMPLLEMVCFAPKNIKRPKCSSMSRSKQASIPVPWVSLAFSIEAQLTSPGCRLDTMLCVLQVNISKMLGQAASFAGLQGLHSFGGKKSFSSWLRSLSAWCIPR